MAEDRVRRLCVPVRDNPFMLLSVPTAVAGTCVQCGSRIWVDAAQSMPPGLPSRVETWCLDCVAADPEAGPAMIVNLKAALTAQEHGLPQHVWRIGRDDGQ